MKCNFSTTTSKLLCLIKLVFIIQKAQYPISMVFGHFSQLYSFFAVKIYSPHKTKPTIGPPTLAFFLAETRVHNDFRTVMSELEFVVKKLSDKFNSLQDSLDKLKTSSGKRKKHKKQHHSRPHNKCHSRSQSRTVTLSERVSKSFMQAI